MDQQINYRVNIDDANFQAKLTQMRASLDQTMMGGGGGIGGGMGFFSRMGSTVGAGVPTGQMTSFGDPGPQSYTPPSIALTPHFGTYQVQQTFAQQASNALGMTSFNPFSTQGPPRLIGAGELGSVSAQKVGDRIADVGSTAMLTAASAGVGYVGGAIGALIGTAVGGPIGGLVGGIGGAMATGKVVNDIGDAVSTNRAIQTDLERGSFRMISGGNDADPYTGRGFSRQARRESAQLLQRQAADSPFEIGELRQIQTSAMSNDLFFGKVNDRFSLDAETRSVATAARGIMRTLHTDLPQTMQTMGDMRRMGISTPEQMDKFTQTAEVQGRLGGRTGQEMMASASVGAAIFQGSGVRMALGGETEMRNQTLVKQMLDRGTLSQEAVAQAGGAEALAQQMTAGGLASTQSQLGRTAMMAAFDPKTGKLKENWRELIAGKSVEQLADMAAKLDDTGIMKFAAHEEDIKSGMTAGDMQTFTGSTLITKAKMLREQAGGKISMDEAFTVAAKSEGLSYAQREAARAALKTPVEGRAMDEATATAAVKMDRETSEIKDKLSLKVQLGNRYENAVVLPQAEAIENLGGGIGDRATSLLERGRNLITAAGARAIGAKVSPELEKAGAGETPRQIAEEAMKDVARNKDTANTQAMTTSMASAPTQQASKAGPRGSGETAAETQKGIDLMSKQLLSNYQQLILMQKELNGLMRGGK